MIKNSYIFNFINLNSKFNLKIIYLFQMINFFKYFIIDDIILITQNKSKN